jgi:hypothetical protein
MPDCTREHLWIACDLPTLPVGLQDIDIRAVGVFGRGEIADTKGVRMSGPVFAEASGLLIFLAEISPNMNPT